MLDYLDTTVFKGPRFHREGIFDTKMFTKPSSQQLHLPFTSHHPPETFKGILDGEYRRSLVVSSDHTSHCAEMVKKVTQFESRGYPMKLLTDLLLQEGTRCPEAFQRQKEAVMQPRAPRGPDSIVALKMDFTPRSVQLRRDLNVSALQTKIRQVCPDLSRESLGRMVIANTATSNLREALRPRGYFKNSQASKNPD
jgi:hypothetical protein